jgi:hypothetical protein
MKLVNIFSIYLNRTITPALVLGAFVLAMTVSAQQASNVPSQEQQLSAVGCLRSINTAEAYYAKEYGKGFSLTLAALGAPPEGAKVSPMAAGLLDSSLTRGTKSNFIFRYSAGPRGGDGKISTYTVVAEPLKWEKGVKSFFTDQTAVIRETDQNRRPRASDVVLK